MKKCPYCQTKTVTVNCKRSELEKLLTWFRTKWFPSAKHSTSGEVCLRKRLTRSEEKRQLMGATLCNFRHAVLNDYSMTSGTRQTVLEHLDTALTENQYEETT